MSTTSSGATNPQGLGPALVGIALVVTVIGSLGAPLIAPVARGTGVSLAAAQWTLTITLLAGAISGPVLGRLGSGPQRRTTIIATLALVCVGGVLTTLDLPFWVLLVGRALQGTGLGVTSLLMSVARDRFAPEKSATTIATLSVTTTVGTGVGYPLIGLVDQVAGLRAAYGLGLVLTICVLVIAWIVIPPDPPGPATNVDWTGAAMLGVGIFGVLFAVAQRELWLPVWPGTVIVAASLLLLWAWVRFENRIPAPLVDVRLLASPTVMRANVAMLVSGIGIYLLFSVLTRYFQTPAGAPYGFGLPGVAAGAALIPFSVLGFVAGKLATAAFTRFSERVVFCVSAVVTIVAAVIFAMAPDSFPAAIASMSVLGFGVGTVAAVMPRLILTDTPKAETASVLSIYAIVRSIGFSIGSAFAGFVLATATIGTSLVPQQHGYIAAALWCLPFIAISMIAVALPRRRDHSAHNG